MNPLSYNMLSQLSFRLVTNRLKQVEYWCTGANVPGISMPVIQQDTAFMPIPRPGRPLNFEPLTVTFKVDEQMENYFEISDWMMELAITDDFDQFDYTDTNTDVVLMILDSNERAMNAIRYEQAFPIGLSALQFQSTDTDVVYVTATAQFAYRRYFREKQQ